MKQVHRRRPQGIIDTSLEIGKLPPQAPELEQAVLSAIMAYPEALGQVSDFLLPDHFYVQAHKLIYKAILHQQNQSPPAPFNAVALAHRLKESMELDIIGGPFYLGQLINKRGGSTNVQWNARIVVQQFIKRQLIATSANTMRDAYDDSVDVFDLLDQHNEGMAAVNSITSFADPVNAAQIIDNMVANKEQELYICFGMGHLDKHVAMGPGCVTVIGARPAVGKTTLVVNGLMNMARDGYKSLFLSLEMNDKQLSAKISSALTGIDSERITRNDINEEERSRIATAAAVNGAWIPRIMIQDLASLKASQVFAIFERAVKRHECKVAVIDYLQLMDGEGDTGAERMANISKACKQAAKASGLRLIEVSQLRRRDGAEVNPEMSDLRESGQIEADGDIIMLLGRERGSNEMLVKVVKNKIGPIGSLKLPFDLISQRIGQASANPDDRIEPAKPDPNEIAPF